MSPLTLGHIATNPVSEVPAELSDALRELEQALDAPSMDAISREALAGARSRAARLIAQVSKRAARGEEIQRAIICIHRLLACDALHDPLNATEREWLNSLLGKEWPEQLAAMILTPAWRWTETPLLAAVPDWLWADYTKWIFAAPRAFVGTNEANQFATHFGAHIEELSRWVERNLGSKTVRAAMESYLATVQLTPLTPSENNLKRHALSHARILAAAMGANRARETAAPLPEGRRLRVGFIASHAAAIPAFARLMDSDRFEVSLHAFEGVDEAREGSEVAISAILSLLQADNKTQKCQQLPASFQEQIARFQEVALDVAFFAEELAFSTAPLAQLATARIAPLQIAVGASSVTTGMLDVFVVGRDAFSAELNEHFTERPAVLPLTGHVSDELAISNATKEEARAALGISPTAFVAVTAARLIEITGDVMSTWVGLLRRVPNSVFLIQLLQAADVSPDELARLGDAWDARLKAAEIAPERGLILAAPVTSLPELQAALIGGDVFIDVAAFGEPDLLQVPLTLGLPVVTREGKAYRARLGAGLLRSLGLNDLVAGDDAHLQEMFELLATDVVARDQVIHRVRTAISRGALCRDALAAAEAIGRLTEHAYQELHTWGARKFRRADAIVLGNPNFDLAGALATGAAALAIGDSKGAMQKAQEIFQIEPAHAEARVLAGRACLRAERFAAAIDYLLAAVEMIHDATAWFDLAKAFDRLGRRTEAIQALEASLRLDGTRADAWVMLVEFARAAGAADMASDALRALRECAPADPRIPGLEAATGHAA